jgi:hypothetical protein
MDKDDDLNVGWVQFDAALSSAQSLPVNQEDSSDWIEFEYMDCDSYAFRAGDRVIVAFAGGEWAEQTIIGFESSPRGCPFVRLIVPLNLYTTGVQYDSFAAHREGCCSPVPAEDGWVWYEVVISYTLITGQEYEIFRSTGGGSRWDTDDHVHSEADGIWYWSADWGHWKRYHLSGCTADGSYDYPCHVTCTVSGEMTVTIHPEMHWPEEFAPQLPEEIEYQGWTYVRQYRLGIAGAVTYWNKLYL